LKPDRIPLGSLAIIGLILGLGAVAFAYTGGWLTPDRLTPSRMIAALSDRGGDPAGHRRNHAKGICFAGYFAANGAGTPLSAAPMFASGRYPVVGRFAIAVGDPAAPDDTGRVESMAIRVVAPDGQEWRSGMNNSPVFVVSNPADFYALTQASDVVPGTDRTDPAALKAFFSNHPETNPFTQWASSAPWTASFADQTYNSLNAFLLVSAAGERRAVRWSMGSTIPPQPVPKADLAGLGPNYLEQDLKRRLAQGELQWHLVVTLAEPGDPTGDATRQWPADRRTIDFGTLVVQQTEDEAGGPCRDYNYDPMVLPAGIEPSDDPLLPARSSAYARSFDLRTAEAKAYPRTSPRESAAEKASR
jgi:catalase